MRFGDPVGKQEQNLAGFDPIVIDRIAELIDRAERGTTFGDELPQTGTTAKNERRIVTGTGVVDLAGAEIENSGEGGHEDATFALQLGTRRCELPVRLR